NVRKLKGYIRKALEAQMAGVGFTMVEVLSQCPTNWGMDPIKAVDWLENNMIPFYKLGEIKDGIEAAKAAIAQGGSK
ncbi:MAG TPA: 2-oxoglutarate oxidoreductase, partial [Treponemataceae bacterium]|nr:2-oxoglutarate oxidoreductase [Treponemataceae bacterium]